MFYCHRVTHTLKKYSVLFIPVASECGSPWKLVSNGPLYPFTLIRSRWRISAGRRTEHREHVPVMASLWLVTSVSFFTFRHVRSSPARWGTYTTFSSTSTGRRPPPTTMHQSRLSLPPRLPFRVAASLGCTSRDLTLTQMIVNKTNKIVTRRSRQVRRTCH